MQADNVSSKGHGFNAACASGGQHSHAGPPRLALWRPCVLRAAVGGGSPSGVSFGPNASISVGVV